MSPNSASVSVKRREFRRLHESGCFVMPNPWDVGSARMLQSLGFKALASTSSGFAWSQGFADNHITREMALAHLAQLVEATDLPVNADFENGFGDSPAAVAESVRLAVGTGVAGLSIEDSTNDAERPIFTIEEAVERVRAARDAIEAADSEVMLVGRAEGFLHGQRDINEICARLKRYSEAGADCLYAPGIKTVEHISAVVDAVAPKPVNLLVGSVSDLTVERIAALGVRRVSVGGALFRAAWGAFERAARLMAMEGRFDGFADAANGYKLNEFFAGDD